MQRLVCHKLNCIVVERSTSPTSGAMHAADSQS